MVREIGGSFPLTPLQRSLRPSFCRARQNAGRRYLRHVTSLRSARRGSPCADQAITPRRRRAADGTGQPGRPTERSTPSLVPAELARRRQTATALRRRRFVLVLSVRRCWFLKAKELTPRTGRR